MNIKYKKILAMISVVLIVSIITPMSLLTASAQVNNYTSYIYVSVNNQVVGLDQELTIITWTADVPIQGAGQTQAERGWKNMEIIITDPDGVNTTLTIDKSDPIGSGYITFKPTEKIGTYLVRAYLPAHSINASSTTQSNYSEAYSPILSFEVQAEPVPTRSDAPVPPAYWTRPLASNMHLYHILAGNWIGGAANQWPQGSANE
ncbi:hypothetical protein, partial [Candidatus Bathycorpusculum sp.]|uniref:hypothetical protein n=1 Tax=Candidatus Bathycorpusculum sp. TaxID=2994959 RepID=UPI0028300039|nr:hypothetical protein [Candidatus Termitimicrobium sp.]MCL2432530.1 hypothetical protein [Candidatus Termitimicrobium sp.]